MPPSLIAARDGGSFAAATTTARAWLYLDYKRTERELRGREPGARCVRPATRQHFRLRRFRQCHDHIAKRFPQLCRTPDRYRQAEVPLGELDSEHRRA